MSIKFHHRSFISLSPSTQWPALKSIKVQYICKLADLDCITFNRTGTRKKSFIRCTEFKFANHNHTGRFVGFRKLCFISHKPKWTPNLLSFASADDGIEVNGSFLANTSSSVEGLRVRLDQSLQNQNYNDGLLQSLHDAARIFELSLKEQGSRKIMWFSATWLGIDQDAWMKPLSYQASIYSLLQAANELTPSGDRQDKDITIAVQRSLLRLSASLETIVREKLSTKHSELFMWFWSDQVPVVVRTFVSHFERDPRLKAATVSGKRTLSTGRSGSDVSSVMLSLICIAAITKLGSTKVSCSQFFYMIPYVTGRLMDMLVEQTPIPEAYHFVKDIGLGREFLIHFGSRAASAGLIHDIGTDEVVFWVDLVQKQLYQAIDREKIWSRLTTSESIEVLEKDLAIFGFFVALGRSTQSFLVTNGFNDLDEPIEGLIRYLIGGSVLYYPQLSSISSYQLYVEVVCEELDWLAFYPGYANMLKRSHGNESKFKGSPNAEALSKALDVCSHWIRSFTKHSKWLENPLHVKAAHFISGGHSKVGECMKELGILKDPSVKANVVSSLERILSAPDSITEEDPGSFKKALESVEKAMVKLEHLLRELHACTSTSEQENLKAACSDLERIRKLKKEAGFLEAFSAKAASFHRVDDDKNSQSSTETRRYAKGKHQDGGEAIQVKNNRASGKPAIWRFLVHPPMKKSERRPSETLKNTMQDNGTSKADDAKLESNEFQRFEILRSELIELEKRVQQSANRFENEEENKDSSDEVEESRLVIVQKNGSIIEKSLAKLKQSSTDVWQGTQLLAVDVAAATGLLRRALIGDELTEIEKKVLRRTMTDLASVIPIGFLMLLPVTAVGHAAMLAAIQRYFPALIPSSYGPERLELLRQLEKVKKMATIDCKADEQIEELA